VNGNYNNDPKDFIKSWWKKGWRYSDDIEIGENHDCENYTCVEHADDITEECDCLKCYIKLNKTRTYWINLTKKEGFLIYPSLKRNWNYASKEHNWDFNVDDIKCKVDNTLLNAIKCGEFKYID